MENLAKKWMYRRDGGVSDLSVGYSTASQLPGRQEGGPADVLRHLVLGAELARRFGATDGGRILAAHEREGNSNSIDSNHDTYINSLSLAIGTLVKNANGTTQDVLSFATAVV